MESAKDSTQSMSTVTCTTGLQAIAHRPIVQRSGLTG
jgi:hypothetical protein